MTPVIYLASKSPRRRELLRQLGVAFEELYLREAAGRHRDVVEEALDGEPAAHYVERIARTKSTVGWKRMEQRKLAVRRCSARIPKSCWTGRSSASRATRRRRADARAAVRPPHEVLTGVALAGERRRGVALSTSQVTFRRSTAEEIARYVATGEALDKAGAYAIQGRAGAFVSRLEGSSSGVMGLPLFETAELLASAGIPVL